MSPGEQERFDKLLEDAIVSLPPRFRQALDEVPVIVLDRPDARLLAELKREGTLEPGDTDEDLMGLHSGIAITHRHVSAGGGGMELPPTIHIFREGILSAACGEQGWAAEHADEELYEEIRITLLHELGHHFGLEEDDLDELGYG
jgi:predicted Zn-dependent protease with MMP-like domain